MNIEKMREEFERVVGESWDTASISAQSLWSESWRLSRAAIEVELPKRDGVNMYGSDVLEINDVRDAIEAAGLKVKS